jgi:plasmid stabilization system protein ParE
MQLRIVRTPQAKEDVLDIWAYVAKDSVRNADALVERFEIVFQALSTSPDIGVTRSDLLEGLRSFPEGLFVIFYRHVGGTLDIVRVVAAARRITPVLFGPD